MDDHRVAWFHETNFPAQHRCASRAWKAYAYRGSWKDAPHYRTLLNGSCTSLPGTDGLGQPLYLARQDDPMSGLGGHAQVDRGDGVSRRV